MINFKDFVNEAKLTIDKEFIGFLEQTVKEGKRTIQTIKDDLFKTNWTIIDYSVSDKQLYGAVGGSSNVGYVFLYEKPKKTYGVKCYFDGSKIIVSFREVNKDKTSYIDSEVTKAYKPETFFKKFGKYVTTPFYLAKGHVFGKPVKFIIYSYTIKALLDTGVSTTIYYSDDELTYEEKDEILTAIQNFAMENNIKIPAKMINEIKKQYPEIFNNKTGKVLAILHSCESDIKDYFGTRTRDKSDKGFTAEVRDWGNWQLPDDADDDEEDYDWQELDYQSTKEVNDFIKKLRKKYPKLDIEWREGEKNWLEFYVKVK